MNTKHAPAPWEHCRDGHGGIYIGDSENRQIGFVSLHPNQGANARLIAASPDLLAMLERILDDSRTPCEGVKFVIYQRSISIEARALINSIKGE